MRPLTITLLSCVLGVSAMAGIPPSGNGPDSLFRHHPERYVHVDAAELSTLSPGVLSGFCWDRSPDGDGLVFNLVRDEWDDFAALGLAYSLVDTDRDPAQFAMGSPLPGTSKGNWDQYPTYDAYEAMMAQYASSYPQLCVLHNIATLGSGRKLLAVKLGDQVNLDEAEPIFLYTSSIHGDETAGYILTLRLIDHLLSNYGTDPRITSLLDSVEIWINPLANPDGTYYGGNNSVSQARRRNMNNVDLNRNYPDPEDGPHPDGNAWQPETMAFMALADSINFTMGANFHGGAEVVNYPWDTWSQLPADDDWWVLVSDEYADTCQYYSPSGYMDDFGTGVTNGYAWYTIDGGRQDYMNYFHHCREVTLEISNIKLLPSSQLENWWAYSYRSLLNYIEQCTYGLHGIVRDSLSHAPLRAFVHISGHDLDSSEVWSDAINGDFHRLLHAGTYDVTFSAPGYVSKTIPSVSIQNYQKTWLSVELVQVGAGLAITETDPVRIYPQPCGERLSIDHPPGFSSYSVYDARGVLLESGALSLLPGTAVIPTAHLVPGTYLLALTGNRPARVLSFIVAGH